MRIKKYILLLLYLCAGCASMTTEKQPSFVVAEKMFRNAIVRKDAKTIENFISEKGVPCGDSVIARQEVLADLHAKGGELYKSLFGNNGLSFRLRLVRDSMVKYSAPFDTPDYQCAIYGVGSDGDVDEVCMRKEAKGWYLSDSLYKCL